MIFYEEVLKAFQKRKVKYVLVGGVAVNLHGAMRSTADLDILVEMSDDNLKKIVEVLKKQGYRAKQPVDPMKIADKKVRDYWIKNKHMKAFSFYKEEGLKELDIIIDSPVSFQQAYKSVINIKAGNLTLPVVSVNELIKMKKKTGRSVDKLDIEELEIIKKMRKKL